METEQSDKDKKQILRSAQYPNITIEEAIAFVSQLRTAFVNSQFTLDDAIAVLKKAGIQREVGACVQYGLLDRQIGKGYKLAPKVNVIINFVTEDEKRNAIIECFKTPKLYIELIERFKGHVVPHDQQLKAILTRFHNITEDAAPKAGEIFVQNATFVGLLNTHRILSDSFTSESPSISIDVADTQELNTDTATSPTVEVKPTKPLLLEEMNGSTNLKIHLSEKKIAHLIYPDNFNDRDIQILKLQLEALALTL